MTFHQIQCFKGGTQNCPPLDPQSSVFLEEPKTVRLTSTGNPVPGNQEFCLTPSETMIEQEEKLRILLKFDDEDLAEEICLILDYLIKSTFT